MNGGTSPFYLSFALFFPLVSKEPTFRFSTSSRRKDIVRLGCTGKLLGGDKSGLASKEGEGGRKEGRKGVDAGASRPPPRGFFISPRSAKVLISGKPSADEIVSCFELPSLESRNAEGSLGKGRERKNE